jgi:hypothetical protein
MEYSHNPKEIVVKSIKGLKQPQIVQAVGGNQTFNVREAESHRLRQGISKSKQMS